MRPIKNRKGGVGAVRQVPKKAPKGTRVPGGWAKKSAIPKPRPAAKTTTEFPQFNNPLADKYVDAVARTTKTGISPAMQALMFGDEKPMILVVKHVEGSIINRQEFLDSLKMHNVKVVFLEYNRNSVVPPIIERYNFQ